MILNSLNLRSDFLDLDCEAEASRIDKKGAAVAMSGGIDSSMVAALSVRAQGSERVFCDIDSKRRFARYLHSPPVLVQELQ